MMDIPGTSAPPLKKIPGYATSVANMSGIGVTETYIFFFFPPVQIDVHCLSACKCSANGV